MRHREQKSEKILENRNALGRGGRGFATVDREHGMSDYFYTIHTHKYERRPTRRQLRPGKRIVTFRKVGHSWVPTPRTAQSDLGKVGGGGDLTDRSASLCLYSDYPPPTYICAIFQCAMPRCLSLSAPICQLNHLDKFFTIEGETDVLFIEWYTKSESRLSTPRPTLTLWTKVLHICTMYNCTLYMCVCVCVCGRSYIYIYIGCTTLDAIRLTCVYMKPSDCISVFQNVGQL